MESILQNKILRDLDSLGKYCVAFKIRKSSVDGVPDIFFTTLQSGPVCIEVKDYDNGVVSVAQENMIKDLNECGCKAYIIRTLDEWIGLRRVLFNK